MKQAIIVSYFNNSNNFNKRTGSPAAINVVGYISEILNNEGYDVTILSPSWIIDSSSKTLILKDDERIRDNCCLLKTPSFTRKGRFYKVLNKVLSRLWLIFQLLFRISCKGPVFVYHEPTLIFPVKLANIFRNFRPIMITEELYSDIPKFSHLNKKQEVDYLRRIPCAYIFPTILLNKRINDSNKAHIIIHGTYHVEENLRDKVYDGKIHIVYAGTFNPTKGGAFAAAAAAEFLTKDYHVHIIGFGSPSEKEELINVIENIKKKTECTLSFDGLKQGTEYTRFIQNCDIGLSVQNPNATYNETSFPSKVLSYLANGLRVISIRIKALETSSVNNLLYYYDEQTPQKLAEAIMKVDIKNHYDSKSTINMLHKKACKDIGEMIEDLWYDKENHR